MIINGLFSVLLLTIFTFFLMILFVLRMKWNIMEIMKFVVTACVYIGYITVILFPMPMDIEDAGFSAINFIPMKTIIGYLVEGVKDGMMENALIQILGNILLFYLLMLVTCWYTKMTTGRIFLKWILFYAVITEGLQALLSVILGFLYRSIDIDDIILYCIGGLLAFGTIKCFKRSKK